MEERITQGMSIKLTDSIGFAEPVLLADVKGFLGIEFVSHDTELSLLTVACRQALEQIANISLISRLVEVSWLECYDSETLPYGPVITEVGSISVKDISERVLANDEFKIIGQGDNHVIIGDFPNGLKLSYSTGYPSNAVPAKHKQTLINIIADVFTNGLSIRDAVIKHRI